MNSERDLTVIANSGTDSTNMSGGDRFFIEYAKVWSKSNKVTILACRELAEICDRENLECRIVYLSRITVQKFGLYCAYFFRIVKSLFVRPKLADDELIFSSSDFLPDVLPAFLYKATQSKRKWFAALHLLAQNPFARETAFNARSVFYFWSQRIAILMMKWCADKICVVNKSDAGVLSNKYRIPMSKIMMIRPGVTIPPVVESSTIQYDGCFVGRFHKQKGIPELLQIWKEVCRTKKDAKLAIIGRGEQVWQDLIKNFIKNNQLDENIVMLGFQDGLEKIKVMQMSRVFLFPSNYESFGIVGLEALACGIPVVSFDLDVFKEIFGDVFTMVRTGDIEAFANKVIALLDDNELLARKKSSGLAFAQLYDWSHGANEVLAEFISKDQ